MDSLCNHHLIPAISCHSFLFSLLIFAISFLKFVIYTFQPIGHVKSVNNATRIRNETHFIFFCCWKHAKKKMREWKNRKLRAQKNINRQRHMKIKKSRVKKLHKAGKMAHKRLNWVNIVCRHHRKVKVYFQLSNLWL